MSDIQTLKQIFEKSKITYEVEEHEFVEEIPTGRTEKRKATKENGEEYLIDWAIKEKVKGKIFILTVERGYIGFCTHFSFREDGSLYDIGAYE